MCVTIQIHPHLPLHLFFLRYKKLKTSVLYICVLEQQSIPYQKKIRPWEISISQIVREHSFIWKHQSFMEREEIKQLNQKTKDRLAIIGLLALESFFVFGSVSNFYRFLFLKIYIDIFLAVFSTILAGILFVFMLVILFSYLDKRKILKTFQK